MRQGTFTRRTFMIMVVAAIALAGCGGSSSKSSSTTAAAAGSSATTSKPAASSGGGGGGSFCGDANAAINGQAAFNPTAGPDALKNSLDQLKKYESEAPSAIKGDVKTLVDDYSLFVNALTTANNDPTKLAAAVAPLEAKQAELQTAAQHIQAYYTSHCK